MTVFTMMIRQTAQQAIPTSKPRAFLLLAVFSLLAGAYAAAMTPVGLIHDYGKSGDDPDTPGIDESAIVASSDLAANKQYAESTRFELTANGTCVSTYKYQKGPKGSDVYNFDIARFSSPDRTPVFEVTLKDGSSIRHIEIYPERYYSQEALIFSPDRKTVTFTLSEHLPYCIVNINGRLTDKTLTHTPMLAIINDPPETDKPDLSASNVLNFKDFAENYLQAHPITDTVGQPCRSAGVVTDASRNTLQLFTWLYDAGRYVSQNANDVAFPNKRARVKQDVSEAFQAALQTVRQSPVLNTIYFPAGTYIWSGMSIKHWNGRGSDGPLNIYLDEDALLVNRLQECKEAMEPAIGIWHSSNITISGRGIIDGNGYYTGTLDGSAARDTPHQGGAMVVQSVDITFNDTYVRDVKQWNWECHTARNITYNNIKGLSPYGRPWVDGLDLTSGKNITVNGALTLGNDDTFASGHYNPSDEFPRRFLEELDRADGDEKVRMEAAKNHICAAAAIYNKDRLRWDTDDSENIVVNDTLGWSSKANNVRLGHNTRWKGIPGSYTSYRLKSYTLNNFNSVMRTAGIAIRVQNGVNHCYPAYESLVFKNCSFAGNSSENIAMPVGSDFQNFGPDTVIIENCWFKDSSRPFIFRGINRLTLKDIYVGGKPLVTTPQVPMILDNIDNLTFTANGQAVSSADLAQQP